MYLADKQNRKDTGEGQLCTYLLGKILTWFPIAASQRLSQRHVAGLFVQLGYLFVACCEGFVCQIADSHGC